MINGELLQEEVGVQKELVVKQAKERQTFKSSE